MLAESGGQVACDWSDIVWIYSGKAIATLANQPQVAHRCRMNWRTSGGASRPQELELDASLRYGCGLDTSTASCALIQQ